MFAGCALVNASAHGRLDELGPVLGMVGVFNVYELAVLALGVWLWRRGGGAGRREAKHLLALAVLLLADTTFVYNELSIADPVLGAGVGLLAAGLGVFKLGLVARTLEVNFGWMGGGVAVAGVLTVFGLPVVARLVGGSGGLPGWLVMGVWWWSAGLMGAAGLALAGRGGAAGGGWRCWVVGVPTGSALLHVGAMHWVYHEPVSAAMVSPVLLALSLVLLLRSGWGDTAARRWGAACGVVGLIAAVAGGHEAVAAVGFDPAWGEVVWSPLRTWLLAAGLGYGLVWWRRRSLVLLMVWPTLWVMAGLGASGNMIAQRLGWVAQQGWRGFAQVTPRGLMAWGVMVVGLAFVALGVGAWVSARRRGGGAG